MKNSVTFLLAAFFCFSLQGKEVVRLAAGEWPPYISEKLDYYGIISHLTTEAFATQGIETKIEFYPWQRVHQVSKNAEVDGAFAYVHTPERDETYLFSEPIYQGKYVLFHLKSTKLQWKDYKDLKDIRIAAPRGFGGMGPDFLAAEEKKVITVDRVTTVEQTFNMLFLGRVQAVPSDLEVGYVLVRQNFDKKDFDRLTHNEKVIHLAKYCLIMPKKSKKSAGLIKKFNLGIEALQKSGRYNQIVKDFYSKKVYRESLPPNYTSSAQVF